MRLAKELFPDPTGFKINRPLLLKNSIMEKRPHFLLLLTYFMASLFIQVRSQDETLQVINTGRFGPRQNTIELECRNDRGETIQGARFWLNEVERDQELTVLPEFTESLALQQNRLMDSGRIIFEITRELEGTYFCGRNLEDYSPEGQQLIAYPDPFIPPSSELRFFAKVGTTARLNCSLLPGALRDRYFADWRNASSSIDVARLIGPRPTPPAISPTPDPRFRVDETTFALSIDSVSFTDAGDYQCVLGVRDPGGRTLSYPQTETVNLTLVVYQAPLINRAPRDRIIALSQSTQSVMFSCSARGDPQPRIEWIHRDNVVEESEKYSIRTTLFRTGTGDFITSSRLIIRGLDAFDAGQVVCRAVNEDERIPAQLQSASRSAQLIVIGSINSFSLLISTNQDVIFKLGLPLPILVPVQLNIMYVDINNPDNMLQMVTKNSYNNTGFITHFEPSSRVPKDFTFRVRIALQYRNMQGPFNQSALTYNLQTPTVFTEEEASVKRVIIISAASVGTVALVVIALLVCVLACICNHKKLQKNQSEQGQENNHEQQLLRERENHEQQLQQERENYEQQLEREQKNHEQQLQQKRENYEQQSEREQENHKQQLQRERENYEQQLQQERENYKQQLKREQENHEQQRERENHNHQINCKLLKIIESFVRKEGSQVNNIDMTDGCDGTDNDSNYQTMDDKCLEDCILKIVQAGMEHTTLVPRLKKCFL